MIEVKNLVKDYGSNRAVDGVSFTVNKGDILGFLGPNGAGKSTTMKMITGFLTPTSGTAIVNGHDVLKAPIAAKSQIGYLPESAPVYGEMSVTEYLAFVAEIRGYRSARERQDVVEKAINLCHLTGVRQQSIETLSKGFRQRVGFAQAVIHNPPILILDEPTDGLDPNQKREVRKIIQQMSKEKAIVLSTHILEEVESLCNRVIIIADGKVKVDETPDKLRLRNDKFNAVTLSLENVDHKEVAKKIEAEAFALKVEQKENALCVYPKDKASIEGKLLDFCAAQGWRLSHFKKLDARMDEVFWKLTA